MSVDDERCHFILVPDPGAGGPSDTGGSGRAFVTYRMVVGLAGRVPGEIGWTHPMPAKLFVAVEAGRFGVEHGDVNRWYDIPARCIEDEPLALAECLADTWLNDYDSLLS